LDEIAPHTLHGAKANAAGGAHSGGAPPNAANPGAGGAVGIGGEARLPHGSCIAERSDSSLQRRTAPLLSTAPIGVRPKEASDTRCAGLTRPTTFCTSLKKLETMLVS
jgi:hypothetical protein